VTAKPRTIRLLKDVRTRLRDAAAAAHANAAALRDQRAAELQESEDTLETVLDEAAISLSRARNIFDVEQVDEDTGVHRLEVLEAANRHAVASAASNASADRLRERARQLRTAERLVELVDDHYARVEARNEQRHTDDLAARRR
jgi:hypothetical protein